MNIIRIDYDLEDYDVSSLLTQSKGEGFGMVEKLWATWQNGSNRFDRTGECLFLVQDPDTNQIVAIGGRSVDPYTSDAGSIGRVRHLYVLPSFRKRGVGSELMKHILQDWKNYFDRMTLRTSNPLAAVMYEKHGFRPVDEGHTTHCLLK